MEAKARLFSLKFVCGFSVKVIAPFSPNMAFMASVSSILGLTPISNNSTSIPDRKFLSSFLYIQVFVICSIGVPLNLLVIYLSLFHKSIKNNYKYLLGNAALSEILLLFSFLASNVVHVSLINNNMVYDPFWCTIGRIWIQVFSVCYYNAVPLVSINRYVIVVLQKEHIFTFRVTLFLCILVYWPLLYPLLAFTFPQYLVREVFCGYMYWFPFIREFLLIPDAFLTISSAFSIVKLYLFLRKHIKTVTASVDKSKLRDEKSLLLTTTIEGLLPIISCFPVVMMSIIGALFDAWSTMNQPWHILGTTINEPYMMLSMGLLQLNPAIDPLLTLFCVRSYRRILNGWMVKYFLKGNSSIVQWSWRRNSNIHSGTTQQLHQPQFTLRK